MAEPLSTPSTRFYRDMLSLSSGFDRITLDELIESDAQLLDRRETKFLLTGEQCEQLLTSLQEAYAMVVVEDAILSRYETEYYDTDSFLLYLHHHNGKGHRFKLRQRHYLSTGIMFFEVKEKTNTGRTIKKRVQADASVALQDQEIREFLNTSFPYNPDSFHPVLMTVYDRITLVSRDFTERITFDLNLTFTNGITEIRYPGIVIGEIKHDLTVQESPAMQFLKTARVRKQTFSKYCVGLSLLNSGLKHNRFKKKLRILDTLSSGGGMAVC